MATREEIERAIDICEHSRLTHVQWRDYLQRYADDPVVRATAEIAGDEAHHVSRIERYDHVLKILRERLEDKT